MPHAVDGRSEAAAGATRYSHSPDRSAMRALAIAGLLGAAMLVGGCSSNPAMVVADGSEFARVVNRSDKPVLMMFFKQGCASCAALEPTMDRLSEEYKDRAVVAKFMIYNFVLGVTSDEIKNSYDITLVPDVILFVNGVQRKRWFANYNIQDYRNALNEAIGPAARP